MLEWNATMLRMLFDVSSSIQAIRFHIYATRNFIARDTSYHPLALFVKNINQRYWFMNHSNYHEIMLVVDRAKEEVKRLLSQVSSSQDYFFNSYHWSWLFGLSIIFKCSHQHFNKDFYFAYITCSLFVLYSLTSAECRSLINCPYL